MASGAFYTSIALLIVFGLLTLSTHALPPVKMQGGIASFLANENFFHSPTVCLPASGWEEKEIAKHLIKDVPRFGSITVTRMIIERMGTRELVYFWFQTKDKATHDKNINRFHLALHALARDNTYDLFIRPIMHINEGERVEDAEKRMDQFVREMMTEMLKFLQEKQIKEKV